MTTMQISPIRQSSLPPAPDKRASDDLDVVKNLMSREYSSAPTVLLEPIPKAIRNRLQSRMAALEQALAPAAKAEHPHLAKAIAGMLGAFAASFSGSVEALVAKYLHILSDLPAWAIIRACEMLERGEVEGASLDHRPSAPRVRQVASSLTGPCREEFFQIRAVLETPALEPEDAATRERVGKMLADLASQLRASRTA